MVQAVDTSYLSIAELAALYRQREVSPVEVTQHLLERALGLQERLHAYITPTPELALAEARQAEAALLRGETASPLLGIPVAYKDIVMTKGIRTTCGSALHLDWVPDQDAAVVEQWRAAGTVMLGKLTTWEFASGAQARSRHHRGAQSLEPGPLAGRLQQRQWRRPGSGAGGGSHRHGHGWQHPRSGCLLRHHRAQAHLRPRQSAGDCDVGLVAGPCGTDGAHGRGCGVPADAAGGLRRGRSRFRAGASGGLRCRAAPGQRRAAHGPGDECPGAGGRERAPGDAGSGRGVSRPWCRRGARHLPPSRARRSAARHLEQ